MNPEPERNDENLERPAPNHPDMFVPLMSLMMLVLMLLFLWTCRSFGRYWQNRALYNAFPRHNVVLRIADPVMSASEEPLDTLKQGGYAR